MTKWDAICQLCGHLRAVHWTEGEEAAGPCLVDGCECEKFSPKRWPHYIPALRELRRQQEEEGEA